MSLRGFDVSHWQHDKGFDIAKMDYDFAIFKATQGCSYVDRSCDKMYQMAKRAGKKLGVYHYFAGGDPVQEADWFIANIKGYIGEAILVLDWEGKDNAKFTRGQEVALPFLDHVYQMTGVRPLIYMSKSVCRSQRWDKVVAGNYGLWMAQYANKAQTGYKTKPWTDSKGTGPFKGYAIFQYTGTGRLPGFNQDLDLDIAYMTRAAWDKYAKPDR